MGGWRSDSAGADATEFADFSVFVVIVFGGGYSCYFVLAAYVALVLFCGGVCFHLRLALCEYCTVQSAEVDGLS